MPGIILPTIPTHDVRKHNSSSSCYVTIGTKVYDVTSFLDHHPGGADLILDYGGQEVGATMGDQISHMHTEAAYEILEELLVGFTVAPKIASMAVSDASLEVGPTPATEKAGIPLEQRGLAAEEVEAQQPKPHVYAATGLSSAEELSKETDLAADYRTHKFLDLNRPMLPQIWFGGFSKAFYLEQVHRPRHYKGGASAPLFGNFLEPLSMTAWWVVPTVWLPPVAYGTYLAVKAMGNPILTGAYWVLGLSLWTLIEYLMHRLLFHVDDYLPDNRVGITAHFLLHGIHHYLPMDRYRLVMPPTLFLVLAIPFYRLAHTLFSYDWYVATAVFCGGIFGYIMYDLTHYFLHHRNLPSYYRELKRYHLQHHFADYQNGFGVTSRFWDRIFGTELTPPRPVKSA